MDICNKTQEKTTYEEDATYEFCKYASTLINELCRTDTDLIIDSYEYDESSGFLSRESLNLRCFKNVTLTKYIVMENLASLVS